MARFRIVPLDTERAQKRLVLSANGSGKGLPFVVWSAGQREFVPLLLGLYWLMTPAGASRRKGINWVVIEELEMGLHPRAISVVLLMIFELAARGYRVCVSTHSPQVLDAMWALKHLRANGAKPESLLAVFEAPRTVSMLKMAKEVMSKSQKVHYFDRDNGSTRDISDLDPSAEENGEACVTAHGSPLSSASLGRGIQSRGGRRRRAPPLVRSAMRLV